MNNERFPITEWDVGDLRLRQCRDTDAEDMMHGCRDPHTQRAITALPSPYTMDDAYTFINDLAPEAWKNGRAQWAIADTASDRLLGSIGIPQTQFGCAEISFWVAPWARSRGIAARAASAIADFLFQHGVERTELHVAAGNIPSQRAALRSGFAFDARLRDGMATRDGPRVDRLVFARLPYDPPGPLPRSIPDLPGGELTDGVVVLRPLRFTDADEYFAVLSEPDVWQRYVPPLAPQREAADALCRFGAAEQWLHGSAAHLTIRDAANGTYAGNIALFMRTGPPGEAMLSYNLHPRWRGRGFVTRAVRLSAGWAFRELGTQRLMAGTAADNSASQAVLQRAGFTREGVQRDLLPGLNSTRVDNVCWSMLPGEL